MPAASHARHPGTRPAGARWGSAFAARRPAWLAPAVLLRLVAGFVVLFFVGFVKAELLSDATPVWTLEETADHTLVPTEDAFSPQATTIDQDARGLDARVAAALPGPDGGRLAAVAGILAGLGKIWFVAPVVAVFGWAVWRRTGRTVAFWMPALAMIGGFALSVSVKLVTFRPRPPAEVAMVEAFGPSYPSGHAIRAVATYGAIALVLSRMTGSRGQRLGIWGGALLLTAAVGGARVLQGVHWATDILASYLLGVGWLVVVVMACTGAARRRSDAS